MHIKNLMCEKIKFQAWGTQLCWSTNCYFEIWSEMGEVEWKKWYSIIHHDQCKTWLICKLVMTSRGPKKARQNSKCCWWLTEDDDGRSTSFRKKDQVMCVAWEKSCLNNAIKVFQVMNFWIFHDDFILEEFWTFYPLIYIYKSAAAAAL